MNKRHGIIAVALVALLLATSCSTFFTGGVSGKVKCNGEPVARATVALYFDEGQRNADFDAQNKVFHTDYKTETQENGSFAITNIPWDDAFPEYGKDADSKTAYAIIYHKDYGYKKIDGITVISGRSNEFFPEFDKETTNNKTVTIKFMDLNNKVPVTGIRSFKYSYTGKPGYDEAYDATVTAANGVATFTVDYVGDTAPTLTISDIEYDHYEEDLPYCIAVGASIGKNGEKELYAKQDTYTVDLNKKTELHINTVPLVHTFSGFDGVIDEPTLNPALVKLIDKKGNVVSSVWMDKQFTEDKEYTRFRGLGSGIVIRNKELNVAGSDPAVKGYPSIITTEDGDYSVQTTISTDKKSQNVSLTSDKNTSNVIVVNVSE